MPDTNICYISALDKYYFLPKHCNSCYIVLKIVMTWHIPLRTNKFVENYKDLEILL